MPLDEEIFTQLTWIANIGIRSRETLLSKGKTHSVPLYILRNLPIIRKTLFPLQYSIDMTPTVHSRKHFSNGSFLTTARALHTMDTLMHNFKGGPNLVKDGEPEYDTLKQDSMLHGDITAALRKLPHTPFMQSLDLDKDSIASFVLQTWSPKICNIIESPTRKPQDPTNPPLSTNSPLSAICRPMLKSSESKSLLALAKPYSLSNEPNKHNLPSKEKIYILHSEILSNQ